MLWTLALMTLATASPELAPEARARQDLELLRMGLAAYRIAHHGRYPEAPGLDALVRLLAWEGELPQTFQPSFTPREFRCTASGYRLRLETGLAIASPVVDEPWVGWLRVGW